MCLSNCTEQRNGRWVQSEPTDCSSSETSARVGFWPHALKRSPRLALGTRPFPFESKSAKASRYWSFEEGYITSVSCNSNIGYGMKSKKRAGTRNDWGITIQESQQVRAVCQENCLCRFESGTANTRCKQSIYLCHGDLPLYPNISVNLE